MFSRLRTSQPIVPRRAAASPPVLLQQGEVDVRKNRRSQWAEHPGPLSECPLGLEPLLSLDRLIIQQQVKLLDIFTGIQANNKYAVMNGQEEFLYFAAEVSSHLSRSCLGSSRPFKMIVLDIDQQEIMHIKRPLRCRNCCCFCCLQRLEVQVPPGTPVGFIEQEITCVTPRFKVYNAARQPVLKVEGPMCTAACFGDVDYYVVTVNERGPQVELVGKLSKTWMGISHESTTDADHYALNFKSDLEVTTKATLLGLSFLIDFMFYDTQPVKQENVPPDVVV